MDAIAECIEGLEGITGLEVKEILKTSSEKILEGRVKFKVKNIKALKNFICHTRSSAKVYELIEKIEFKDMNNLEEELKKTKIPKIKSPFVVRCQRSGEHNFSSIDIESSAGEIILSKNKNLKVDLKNPKTTIIMDIINSTCFMGIDHTKIRLTKRDYRIRLIPNPINPCIAYSMLRISGAKEKETILDPFCKSGEIPIEAAMYFLKVMPNKKNLEIQNKSRQRNKKLKIYCTDSAFNNLKSAEINSKIAGICKNINFSKIDIEWLDTKFKKNSVDKIITFPPYPTLNTPLKNLEKIYKELFYQAEYILRKKGSITVFTPVPEIIKKYAELNKFKKETEVKTKHMKMPFFIAKFGH